MKQLITILFFIIPFWQSAGQNADVKIASESESECRRLLNDAEHDYISGNFLKCIGILTHALDSCHLSRGDNEDALELISKAYVETGDVVTADTYVNRLLKKYPHYDLKEEDNPEAFNRLVKKYIVHPLFSIGLRNSGNWMRYKYIEVYSLLDGLNYDVPFVYQSDWATSRYYGFAEYEFARNKAITADLKIFNDTWERVFFEEPSFHMRYYEKTSYLELPVYYKQYFDIVRNFEFYGAAGVVYQRVLNASGNASISYTKDDIITGKNEDFSSETLDIDMLKMRIPNTIGLLIETGFLFKLKNVKINLFMRYMNGLNSFTNTDKRLDNKELTDVYYYVDSKIKMTQFELGASISYTFFNSVKKEKRWIPVR